MPSSVTADASRARRTAAACRIGSSAAGSAAVARSSATSAVSVSGRRGRSATGDDGDAQLGDETAGPRAVVLRGVDRGDHQAAPGPGDRDVEQPALLGEQLGRRRGRGLAVGRQLLGVEQRAAAAEVGPAVLLDVDDDHELPLEALAPVGGEHADGVAAQRALGQGVGGDLLRLELLEEGAGTAPLGAVLEPRGGLEERDDRVEVAVGEPTGRPAGPGRALEPTRPGRAVPQRPEHVVGRATVDRDLARRAEQRGEPRGGTDDRVLQGHEPLRLREDLADQLGAGSGQAQARPGALVVTQQSTEPPEPGRLHAAERAEQQVGGGLLGEERRVGHHAQGEQERSHRRLAGQRELVRGDLHRHARGAEHAAQVGQRPDAGADEHGHLRPGQAVVEVRAAQHVGHRVELGRP